MFNNQSVFEYCLNERRGGVSRKFGSWQTESRDPEFF